jgi:uncharacterized protein (TIGR03435 family)
MKNLLVLVAASTVLVPGLLAERPVHAQATFTPLPQGSATPPASDLAFEVASVKPNRADDGRVMLSMQPGGRFTATNVALRMLIRQAYEMQDFQIVNGPGWIGTDRFDVVAKAPEGEVTADRLRPMLRALLAERFHLAAHTETREMSIYALVKARSDGKLGPKLTASTTDCTAARGRRGGPPPAPPQPGQRIDCGLMMGLGRMNAGGMPLTELARTLSQQVGRVVVDKTGLAGTYDFELTYTPENLGLGGGAPPQLNGGPAPAIDPNAPTLFTALQEQLGLKLDSDRGPVTVLVIDRVEQPTAD